MISPYTERYPQYENMQPLILLDPAMMIPYDLCRSFNDRVYNAID